MTDRSTGSKIGYDATSFFVDATFSTFSILVEVSSSSATGFTSLYN